MTLPFSPDAQYPLCPICQSESRQAFMSKHSYLIVKCQSRRCGHLFVGHSIPQQPEPEEVVDDRILDQIPETYVDRNQRLFDYWRDRNFVNETGTFLDFGCGVGHISKGLRTRYPQLQITCIEIKQNCLDHLSRSGFQVASDLDAVPGNFDAILLLEVIEHIPDPIALLTKLRSRLTETGKIFLTTPCGQLKSGSFKLEAHEDPTHIHFFTENSLKLACKSAGFQPIQLELIEAMYPRTLPGSALQRFKLALRRAAYPVIASVRGYAHLTGFVQPGA